MARMGNLIVESDAAHHQTQAALEAKLVALAREQGRRHAALIHRVRAGETLSAIAKRYGVYVSQIAKWNYMKTRDMIRMGQKLLIWTSRDKVSERAPMEEESAARA